MLKDPIIAELRTFRDNYARKHGYCIRAIVQDLNSYRPPKPLQHQPAKKKTTKSAAH